MDNGIEVNQEITNRLIRKGHWPQGTLIFMDGQVFMILGYDYWGWPHDGDDSKMFFDIILHHVATGFVSSFPLARVIEKAKLFKEDG